MASTLLLSPLNMRGGEEMDNIIKVINLAIIAKEILPGTCPFDCDEHMVCSGGAGTGCGCPIEVI